MITLEQIKSVMMGHAVGDAMGVPMEFTSREYLRTQPVTYMMDAELTHKCRSDVGRTTQACRFARWTV